MPAGIIRVACGGYKVAVGSACLLRGCGAMAPQAAMAILVRKPQRAEALLPWMQALVLAHTAYFIASPGWAPAHPARNFLSALRT